MAYDAAAWEAALAKPEIEVRRTYWWERPLVAMGVLDSTIILKGRLISHQEWLPFEAGFIAVERQEMEPADIFRFYERFFRACGIPPRRIRHLPWKLVLETVNSFLHCQLLAVYPQVDRLEALVSGQSSTLGDATPSASPNGHLARTATSA